MPSSLPPFLIFFLGALVVPLLSRVPRVRMLWLVLIPIVGALNAMGIQEGYELQYELLGYTLTLVRADRLAIMFGHLFHLGAFIAIVYSLHLKKGDHATVQHTSAVVYAGSAIGAVFAGDFITLFVFWELLAVSSVFLIWTRRSPRAVSAGMRYLLVHIVSGVTLLAGAMVHAHNTGSLDFGFMGLEGLAGWLVLLGFGVKAAFPLLHSWLIDAYPEGTPTGTVFLSAFTTKVAVYALARGYAGTDALIYIGAVMACFPIFYAVIENDLRRTLGYSMINQIGFMVCGIGVGTHLAINGAVSHAFNDVLFKGLLFMSMGAVMHMTGKTKASDLGGLYKTMPWTATLCIVGALSISAVPLFNAFVSKSMIMSALLEEHFNWIWPVMLFASAGVVEHAGIKIPFFAFFAHDSGIRTREPPWNMLAAMGVGAVACLAIGVWPELLYGILPHAVDYEPYTASHILTQLQLLAFAIGAVAAFHLWKIYPAEIPSVNLDADWVYRRAAARVVRFTGGAVGAADAAFRSTVVGTVRGVLRGAFRAHGPRGILARTWPAGSMVLWVSIILAAFLLLEFL
ncbi:MAG: Na(+)/H(+) antiporter subunit D [Gemmatimonadetes bacterium]|nr:Na(+)/H(+) antiporter subunit D [Gemmatimonadota bacterium]MYA42580.1 Na(+)/H(+) antiporter subunit D [Gemmatimonadota bacterium]MYE95177.1 Na(+)/H(+) antiporter subunit D [Gemmatimonadota bacterium]MYJ09217.1 Na(+)/H(+) antiporter subunit D [Gemmatimonadota bacterium]